MKTDRFTRFVAAAGLVLALVTAGYVTAGTTRAVGGQGSEVQPVPDGQKMKILGIVLKRSPDSFIMKDQAGTKRAIALTPSTEVKTHKKGVFRGGKEYGVSYILRGLRLEAEGVGNSQGQLVAKTIRFDEDDLRTAQALEARVDPVEELAAENRARVAAAEEEARKQAQEIEKNTAAAMKAQETADRAHNRINGLDEFDPIKTITVVFATGSSTLGPKGRAEIDAAAAWTKTQNTKGWVVAVVGFADTTGNTAANRKLSELRANAVIGYLVTKHNLPLQRLVQPFGYGEDKPVAENTTAEGRAKNRRVEIRLMANKGIAGTGQ
jgi:outer membrane protein OmpA-like peptidoglycan-associated protein